MPRLDFAAKSLLVLALFLAANSGQAKDTTYDCRSPPDKGARLAVRQGSQVSKTQDNQSGECIFSVNGAVATSPPPESVIAAVNLFRDPSLSFVEQPQAFVPAIAALLAAPAPVNEVPHEVINALQEAAPALRDCMRVFFVKRDTIQTSVGGAGCRVLRPYEDPASKAAILARDGVAAGSPTLEISLRWEGGRFLSYTFLPIETVGLQKLQILP